ncbi:MAG: efflux RND transporter periplasmic adaptor subunit [Betaproteobacteria bacterium]|nr:efflux RND transporter periplasmic adaptor subunit [Betaproteobacteria bacterium]MBL8534507.1 efflux RND transporter periplasmic adaptor subunit [Betaproteobacteria bacterium]
MTLRAAVVGISLLSFTLAGCGSKTDGAPAAAKSGDGKPAAAAGGPPKGLPVKAQRVKVDLVQNEINAVGTLMAAESIVVRPEIAGRIVSMHFSEGQPVQKGAKLVTLDPAEYQAQLAASAADARTESQKYQRARDLLEQKFVSQEAVDLAKGGMERAAAKRLADEVLLAKTTVVAPFSGNVGLRYVSPGAYVKAGDDIVRLESTGTLKLDFRVPEVYVSKIHPKQTVTVRTDAYPGDVFEGHIYALEPAVDEKTRTVLARAEIPNRQGKLRPGMFGRVAILLESRPNAIVIPEQAIWPQGRDTFVFRVVDGKATLTKIQMGIRRPGEVEVAQGLGPDDMVVTDGQLKLKDGAPVMVLPAAPAAAAAAPGGAAAGKAGAPASPKAGS